DSLAARKQIGYLPGDLPIYPDLSARDYLDYLAHLDSRPVAPDYLRHLMARPAVVILDEPTAGLDPMMVQAFRETVAELKRGGRTTVFLSSHVLAEVESTC